MADTTTGLPAFQQIHIDAARNSTDDFNPFHDPTKWQRISGNPFGGTIVLGFQLQCLVEYLLTCQRREGQEAALVQEHDLPFANYQMTFADVLHPGQEFQVEIKPGQFKETPRPVLSNRIAIRRGRGLVMIGFVRQTDQPLYAPQPPTLAEMDLRRLPDRKVVTEDGLFHKRKFLTNGNAKNFISGALADQSFYFDELEDRIDFPDMVPVALISCALLERARNAGHDFYRNPMVYTSHQISVDHRLARRVRSNQALHMLVEPPVVNHDPQGRESRHLYRCYGLLQDRQVLYRAEIQMAPLAAILASQER